MDEKTEVQTDERKRDGPVSCMRGAGTALDKEESPGTVQEAMSYIAAYLDNFSGTWAPTLNDGRPNHLGASLVMLWKWLGNEADRRTASSIEPRGEGWSL